MDYKKKIKDSSIIFKIKGISRQVFSQWLENAKEIYGLSPDLVDKTEDDKLEDTFLDHFAKALRALVEEKSEEKKSIPGWSFGFLCGYLRGSLDVEWTNKYIIEPSKEYEDIIKIKAIREYINWNDESLNKIYSIYDYLISQRVQPLELIDNTSPNIVSIFSHVDSRKIKINAFKKEIIDYLSDDIEKKYLRLLNTKRDDCCPDITGYLNIEDIKQIIGDKHFA